MTHLQRLLAATAALSFLAAASSATIYTGTLSGGQENPSNSSTAAGTVTLDYNPTAHTLALSMVFSGLTASATAAHIHCCAAAPTNAAVGIVFTGFPLTTSGTFSQTFDLTNPLTYTPTLFSLGGNTAAGAEAVVANALVNQQLYVDVHDALFPGGEIRGYPAAVGFQPQVPTLSGIALAILAGMLALAAAMRMRARVRA